jgi:hypothetical protein
MHLRLFILLYSSSHLSSLISSLIISHDLSHISLAYHEGFNKSVKSFNHILASVSDCQSRVDTLKLNVERSKGMFSSRAQETRLRWAKLLEYQHMLAILDKMYTSLFSLLYPLLALPLVLTLACSPSVLPHFFHSHLPSILTSSPQLDSPSSESKSHPSFTLSFFPFPHLLP